MAFPVFLSSYCSKFCETGADRKLSARAFDRCQYRLTCIDISQLMPHKISLFFHVLRKILIHFFSEITHFFPCKKKILNTFPMKKTPCSKKFSNTTINYHLENYFTTASLEVKRRYNADCFESIDNRIEQELPTFVNS